MPLRDFMFHFDKPRLSLVCTNRRCNFMKATQDVDVSKCPECGSKLKGLDIPLPRETDQKK